MVREMFEWNCQLQRDDGHVVEKPFKAFWSPAKTEPQSVAVACAAMETRATGRKHVGIRAELIAAEA